MSFKQFSTAQDTPGKVKPVDAPMGASAVELPAKQADKATEESGPPAPKS